MVTSTRAMRWDPLMIRWCLYLRHLSGSAYELIRESGVISLEDTERITPTTQLLLRVFQVGGTLSVFHTGIICAPTGAYVATLPYQTG